MNIYDNHSSVYPGEQSGHREDSDKEKQDHEVREGVETVVPETENPHPGPDQKDEEQKSEK